MYFILFYSYGPDAAERRAPYRTEHLRLLEEGRARGEVVMAGAYASPPGGAAIIFDAPGRETVEAFVAEDPYVANGIVTGWEVREWTVAVGGKS